MSSLDLKAVLAECAEALREREMASSTRSAVNCEQSYACCPSGRCTKSELARTRAALAVVERWAAVEVVRVPVEDDDGALAEVGFHIKGRFPDFSTDRSPSGGKWYILGQRSEPLEMKALLNLAASLECRRRNGEAS